MSNTSTILLRRKMFCQVGWNEDSPTKMKSAVNIWQTCGTWKLSLDQLRSAGTHPNLFGNKCHIFRESLLHWKIYVERSIPQDPWELFNLNPLQHWRMFTTTLVVEQLYRQHLSEHFRKTLRLNCKLEVDVSSVIPPSMDNLHGKHHNVWGCLLKIHQIYFEG